MNNCIATRKILNIIYQFIDRQTSKNFGWFSKFVILQDLVSDWYHITEKSSKTVFQNSNMCTIFYAESYKLSVEIRNMDGQFEEKKVRVGFLGFVTEISLWKYFLGTGDIVLCFIFSSFNNGFWQQHFGTPVIRDFYVSSIRFCKGKQETWFKLYLQFVDNLH